ncbi:hypothetical protein BpHYR1_051469, partial [Brachionus plicatilis]
MKQWGENNIGWFEGYAPGLPSTSNSLKSTHDKIKETMKGKRLELIAFLDKCQKVLVKNWSIERSPILKLVNPETNFAENNNQKKFSTVPDITKQNINDAYGWNCLNKTIQTWIPGTDYFYVKEGLFYDLSRNECKEYEQKL